MAQAPNNLGSALLAQGKPDEAIACYRQAIELAPTPSAVAFYYNNLGLALNGQGKPEEAIACYRKAIELDPQGTAAYTNLCPVLLDLGKVDEAEAVGRTAVKVEVERTGPVPVAFTRSQLYNLACFYSRASAAVQADPQKAEEHAAQALALLRKVHAATGWPDVATMANDRDLDAIRDREDFRQLLQELEEKDKK
jgi:tetratricopeptide (TPR) repeat protein